MSQNGYEFGHPDYPRILTTPGAITAPAKAPAESRSTLARAAELLREWADELRTSCTRDGAQQDWSGEDEAHALHDELLSVATEVDGQPEISKAARSVLTERARHVAVEGWTPEHDDAHSSGQLSDAAACYALASSHWPQSVYELFWPWESQWWKPGDAYRNLEKAAALTLAEMERLDRIVDRRAAGADPAP